MRALGYIIEILCWIIGVGLLWLISSVLKAASK